MKIMNMTVISALFALLVFSYCLYPCAVWAAQARIAILEFDSLTEDARKTHKGRMVSEMFITSAVKCGIFNVVERENIRDILDEMEFGESGKSYGSVAQKVGTLVGADSVIAGTISEYKGQVRIDARIISVKHGSVLAADNEYTRSDLQSMGHAVDNLLRRLAAPMAESSGEQWGDTPPFGKNSGTILLKAEPADAAIRFKNSQKTYAPGMSLPAGKFVLQVSREGYAPAEVIVEIRNGEQAAPQIQLVTNAKPASTPRTHQTPGEAASPAAPQLLGANSVTLRFFQGGRRAPARESRTYDVRFDSAQAPYIYWELQAKYPSPLEQFMAYSLRAVYTRANGTLLHEQVKRARVEAGSEEAVIIAGCGREKPGAWKPGRYRLTILLDEQVVVSEDFSVH
jgi:TolB-like protein